MGVICERFDGLGREDPSRTYRLGLMGGTFDPIHIGHLACAEQVRQNFGLDAVVFIPTGVPVYKRDADVSPAADRLAMCRLACAGNPAFDVSPIETERAGDTYTVDTLQALRAHYPDNVRLFFITGADAVFSIIKWRDSALVAGLAHFIAVARPGYVISEEQKRAIRQESDYEITYTEVTALAISSSDLRSRVAQGKSVRYLTMQCVNDYIAAHGLYLKAGHD